MKKLISLLLCFAMALSLAACSLAEEAAPRLGALSGPTAIGMAQLLTADNVYAAADELAPLFNKGEIDIASVPVNLIANLYNNENIKEENKPVLLAINTLGVLYIVEKGSEEISAIEDLQGKTLYATGAGSTPEYALTYLLSAHGLEIGKDVNVEFRSSPNEVLPLLNSNDNAVAMLPQPFVTVASAQVEGLRVALDLTAEWDALDNGSRLITSGIMARRSYAEQHPEEVAAFLNDFAASVEFVNGNVEEAAKLVEELGIVKAAVAQKAIPQCNIVCITGDEAREILPGYLETLLALNPASIGGSLPGDDFYWHHEAE
ncbi:MAG: ABC transporter substrate-binding protein [Clostridia bacterium]|nr:ABC transporter substrate-binding protein [Clostridia bacterium]